MLILALALTAAEATPLSQAHQRDIGCVAVLGLIAYDQGRNAPNTKDYPDVREPGKRWAGIVGDRVMSETGQPREVVAIAMNEAVKTEQSRVISSPDPETYSKARFGECAVLMYQQLADNLPNFRIEMGNVDMSKLPDGRNMVAVTGEIVNLEADSRPVPRLLAEIKDDRGRVVFSWIIEPEAKELAAGSNLKFGSVQLDIPETSMAVALRLADEWPTERDGHLPLPQNKQ